MGGKDLAGLAALGTLGYMLANRKKDADVDTSKVQDMDLTGGARSMTPDTGEILAEDGTPSKLRRNTETGDLYSPNEPITRPSASSVAKVQQAVRNPSSTKMASQQFPMTKAPEYTPSSPKSQSKVGRAGQASGSSDEPSFQDKMAMEYLQNKRDRESGKGSSFGTSQRSRPYMKDGGKVVKMAKGGLTASSASRRADGIAQRGKTKGTMIMCGGGYTKGKK